MKRSFLANAARVAAATPFTWPCDVREELRSASDDLRGAADGVKDPRVADRGVEPLAILGLVAEPPVPLPPDPSARMSVALLGRTKAGKSQLVAALTGDERGAAVVVGKQRTTRVSSVHEGASFTIVDTPDVAALGGEADTRRARRSAADADAVLWVCAESLHEEKAQELEELLRTGKAVVVAFNAKWSVDDPDRREVFVEAPELAFRDLAGHAERVRQIADRAGTRAPTFVAVHARAAWWSLREDDPQAAAELRAASRLDDLVRACDDELTARATALRILKAHDDCRRRLVEYAGTASEAAERLLAGVPELRADLDAESAKLTGAVASAHRSALARLRQNLAEARAGVPAWVERNSSGTDLVAAWAAYVEASGLDGAIDAFAADVAEQSARTGRLLEATSALRESVAARRSLAPPPGRGLWARLRSAAKVVVQAVVRVGKSFTLTHGVRALLARLAGRAVPGVNVVMIVGEALAAAAMESREELRQRRAAQQSWSRATRDGCANDLAELRRWSSAASTERAGTSCARSRPTTGRPTARWPRTTASGTGCGRS